MFLLFLKALLGFQQEHGDVDTVLDPAGGYAEEQIRQETMAVRAHRYQVAALLSDPLDYFRYGISVSQLLRPLSAESSSQAQEIRVLVSR